MVLRHAIFFFKTFSPMGTLKYPSRIVNKQARFLSNLRIEPSFLLWNRSEIFSAGIFICQSSQFSMQENYFPPILPHMYFHLFNILSESVFTFEPKKKQAQEEKFFVCTWFSANTTENIHDFSFAPVCLWTLTWLTRASVCRHECIYIACLLLHMIQSDKVNKYIQHSLYINTLRATPSAIQTELHILYKIEGKRVYLKCITVTYLKNHVKNIYQRWKWKK